jgi:O-antigen ligase
MTLPASVRSQERPFGEWTYTGHLLTIWGIALSNACLGLLVLWSGWNRRQLDWGWPRTVAILRPMGCYLIFSLVSILASEDPLRSAGELSELFSFFTLPLAWILWRGPHRVRRLFDFLIVMTGLLAVYGMGQYLLTDYGPLDNRIPGPFSHYQTFSGVLLVGNLLLLARMATGDGWRKPLHWVGLAVINVTLLLSLTRGPWLAVVVVIVALLVIKARRRRIVLVCLGLGLLGVTLFAVLAPGSWKERVVSIADLQDNSNYDRLCMAWAGLHMISDRPLFGLGPDMVRELYPIYRHPTAPRPHVAHLHNTFVHLAAERGLPTLIAYLWLMGAVLRLAWQGYRRSGGRREDGADLYLATVLVVLGFNVAGLFEANWHDTEVQRLVLFLLAVPCCLDGTQHLASPDP